MKRFAVLSFRICLVIAGNGCDRKANQIRQGVQDVEQHAQEIQSQVNDQPKD